MTQRLFIAILLLSLNLAGFSQYEDDGEEVEYSTTKKKQTKKDMTAFTDKLSFSLGGVFEIIDRTDVFSDSLSIKRLIPYYGIALAGNYTFLHKDDIVSLSFNPNIHFALSLGGNQVQILAQVPMYFLGRVGAGATPFNQQKVGFGLGIGGTFTHLFISNPVMSTNHSMLNPTAMAELNLNINGATIYTLRAEYSFARWKQKLEIPSNSVAKYTNYGFSLLYSF